MPAPDAGNPRREPPLSVARKWLPWCAALIFAMTVGWTALTAWAEVDAGQHQGIPNIVIAVVNQAAPAAPLIVIYAIMIVSALDIAGGFAMVTAKYLTDNFLEPWREKRREKVRAEGRAEGLAKGLVEGENKGRAEERSKWDEERRKWIDWNRRRLEAESNGVPFDEPPPES